jgi:hypothetical protein
MAGLTGQPLAEKPGHESDEDDVDLSTISRTSVDDTPDWLKDTSGQDTPTKTQPLSEEDQVLVRQDWHMMSSSNVDEIRFIPDEIDYRQPGTLEVRFLNNTYYSYHLIPPHVFLAMLVTDSPGRYVWNVLRAGADGGYASPGYDYVRIGSGAIPIMPTGNVRRTANVVRRLLPEEERAHRATIEQLRPGEAARVRRVPLDQANWRRENIRATPAQVREWRRSRKGR